MKICWSLAALPIAMIASQALAENWITVLTDDEGFSTRVDKDSIRRGSDGIVHYIADIGVGKEAKAADCQRRLLFVVNPMTHGSPDWANWRNEGLAAKPGSFEDTELQFVCANAG